MCTEYLILNLYLLCLPDSCVSFLFDSSYLLKVPFFLSKRKLSLVPEAAYKHGILPKLLLPLQVSDPYLIVAPHLFYLCLEVSDPDFIRSVYALVLIANHAAALALMFDARDRNRG